jgi:hypothetical protein
MTGGAISSITLKHLNIQALLILIVCTVAPHRVACPALCGEERKLSLFSDVDAEGAVKESHKTLKRGSCSIAEAKRR